MFRIGSKSNQNQFINNELKSAPPTENALMKNSGRKRGNRRYNDGLTSILNMEPIQDENGGKRRVKIGDLTP